MGRRVLGHLGGYIEAILLFFVFFLGGVLGSSWGYFGHLRALLGLFGGIGALLGLFWGALGRSWGGPLGALLGLSWVLWGASCGHLGGPRSKEGGSSICAPPPGPSK